MKLKLVVLIIILLLVAEYTSPWSELEMEDTKIVEWQKVYRCCGGECYLVEGYTEQYNVIREVSREEVYRSDDPLILSNRYCPKEMVFKNK